uniref:hypothetical protein n=1 Tax=Nonomuraea sp. CA-251285 TaxID=3240002 RepID=UPI003F497E09
MTKRKKLLDHAGREVVLGATVQQRNVYDRDMGALAINCLREGKVVGVGTSRAEVDFGREAVYAFRSTGEPALPVRIHSEYLEVIADPDPAEMKRLTSNPVMVADVTAPGTGVGYATGSDVGLLISKDGNSWVVRDNVTDDPMVTDKTLSQALRKFAYAIKLTAGAIELRWETRNDVKELYLL